MSNRRRINISVDEDMYKRLMAIKDAYGFKNVCEFNVALLSIALRYIDAAEERASNRITTDGDTITGMFNELGNWERTPNGVVPIHTHHKSINNG